MKNYRIVRLDVSDLDEDDGDLTDALLDQMDDADEVMTMQLTECGIAVFLLSREMEVDTPDEEPHRADAEINEPSCLHSNGLWYCERQMGHPGNHMAWADYESRMLYRDGEWR